MQKFISSSVFSNLKDAAALAEELGVGLEISRISVNLENIDKNFHTIIQGMKRDLEGFKGEISLHAFFFDLCVISADPEIAGISIKRFQQSLEAAKFLNAKTVVFHTGFVAPLKHKIFRETFKKNLILFWKEFIKLFEDAGITAVLENMLEEGPDFILDVVNSVNSPNLKVSLNIGHVNIHSAIPVTDWIKHCGSYIYHMHIHNNYGDDDSHFSVLKGTVNIQEVFKAIENLNPKIVFEIFTKEDVVESIEAFDNYFESSMVN
jgi:sugar phosphate isomerase/epimerase